MKKIYKICLGFIALALVVVVPSRILAATGEGTATINAGANATVVAGASTVFTVVLTVGVTGISATADSPTFTIPASFTAPHAAGGAVVPTNAGEVNVEGEWFAVGAGGTCAVTMGTSSATGQVITVDVTGACATTNTITLTYKGTRFSATTALPVVIQTDDAAAGGARASIATPPTITVTAVASPTAVNLLTAGDFTILSKTGISTTGVTAVTGDLGVSPVTSTAVTGFGLILDSSNTFATSSLVTGRIYASDYTAPTPAMLTQAVSDMETAYTAANAASTTVLNAGAGNIGGLTLPAGVYTFGTSVTIPTTLTLNGGASDVWIFQISGDLSIASATSVLLTGGATANNVFWAVAGTTTLGTTSAFKGTILGGPATTTIALNTGATLLGKALGQKNITLDANTVSSAVASATNILVAGVTGFVSPDVGATPGTTGSLTAGAGTYTVTSLTWSPTDSPFNAGQVYTATVVLTSAGGSKFSSAGIPVPTINVGGTVSAGVTAGGNVSGNTLTYTVTFPATSTPSSSGSRGGGGGNSNPVTPTNTPVTCSPGQMFSTTTGQKCTASTGLVFCPPGQMYNTNTGERCNSVSNSSAPGASGYAFGSATVKMGTKGEACRAWQMFFNAKAGANLATDGNCGPLTMAVAKKWQSSMGLVSDGFLGPMSRAKAKTQ